MARSGSVKAKLKSLKYQILFLALVPIAGFSFTGLSSYKDIQGLNAQLNRVHEGLVPTLESLSGFDLARESLKAHVWEALSHEGNIDDRKEMADDLVHDIADVKEYLSDYSKTPLGPYEKEHFPETKKATEEYLLLVEQIQTLLKSPSVEDLHKAKFIMDGRLHELDKIVGEYSEEVIKQEYKEAEEDRIEAEKTEKKAVSFLILSTLLIGGGVALLQPASRPRIAGRGARAAVWTQCRPAATD